MLQISTLSRIALLIVLALPLAGCEVIGGIFKAGMWVGALGVVLIAVLLVVAVAKMRG
jgi:uncharacterized membrane protein